MFFHPNVSSNGILSSRGIKFGESFTNPKIEDESNDWNFYYQLAANLSGAYSDVTWFRN